MEQIIVLTTIFNIIWFIIQSKALELFPFEGADHGLRDPYLIRGAKADGRSRDRLYCNEPYLSKDFGKPDSIDKMTIGYGRGGGDIGRHGTVIPITAEEYNAIVDYYNEKVK